MVAAEALEAEALEAEALEAEALEAEALEEEVLEEEVFEEEPLGKATALTLEELAVVLPLAPFSPPDRPEELAQGFGGLVVARASGTAPFGGESLRSIGSSSQPLFSLP